VLVELGVVEQRFAAVREVLEGATVVDVARRNGVARQVHDWLRKYATGGMAALVDRSSKPARCAHQMAPAVEARWWSCVVPIPDGALARSCTDWPPKASTRCPVARRCTGRWCAMG
jgi:hypothetical protein